MLSIFLHRFVKVVNNKVLKLLIVLKKKGIEKIFRLLL